MHASAQAVLASLVCQRRTSPLAPAGVSLASFEPWGLCALLARVHLGLRCACVSHMCLLVLPVVACLGLVQPVWFPPSFCGVVCSRVETDLILSGLDASMRVLALRQCSTQKKLFYVLAL